MKFRGCRPFAGAVALALVLLLVSFARLSAGPAPQRIGKTLTSAEECGRCHRDIYRYWKASVHAQSADDPRFQAVFGKLKEEGARPDLDQLCLRCHAPALLQGQDFKWERKVSWEGVTCDFCHSVRNVRADAKAPFVLEVGLVKAGPMRNAQPTVHGARYAPTFGSSMLCNPCHQFTNDKGLQVLSTYAEWEGSTFAARSTTCQTCHMRSTAGRVVESKSRAASTVNLHQMPGGHSVTELNRALLALVTAERRGNTVDVAVQLNNRGAGHKLPTGSPLRSILMLVQVDAGTGKSQTATKEYRRVVVDERNQELTDEASIWLHGARVVRDDRLAPGEKRIEKFTFQASPNAPVRAVAKFYYRYTPDSPNKTESGQPFLSVSKWLDAGANR